MRSPLVSRWLSLLPGAALAAALALVVVGSTRAAPSPFAAVDLGPATSSAMFVNDAGQVAGMGPSGAFMWSEEGGVVTLGDLGGDRAPTLAGMNEKGQLVGRIWYASGSYDAISFTQEGGVADIGAGLGYSAAMGVNDVGQVTGWMLSYPSHRAFLWSKSGGRVALGALNDGSSDGMAINNAGTVVGGSFVSLKPAVSHAFLWTPAGGMVDLGTLGGTTGYAEAVSDAGQVVGYSTTASGDMHAFSWTQAGGMVDLGTLGGTTSNTSQVNEAGQVVGSSTTASGETHAFSWTQAGGMVDLGTLGGTTSAAAAVNDAGQVVGYSTTALGDKHAFSWTKANGMVDLGTLGGTTSQASDINNQGDVVGSAFTGTGEQHAVVWRTASASPPAAPSTPDLVPASDDGASPSDNVTSLTALSFRGTAQQGLTVTLLRDGAAVGTTTSAPDWSWTIGDTVPRIGSYGYTARATDAAGHVSPVSGALEVTVVAPGPAPRFTLVDLGSLGSSWTNTYGVNDAGQVVGQSATPDGHEHAFSATQAGGIIDLGTLGGSSSTASAVNNAGLVVGSSATASGAAHAFSWTQAGGMIDLGPGFATDVNDRGQIVGGGPNGHAYMWTPGGGTVDLGKLPGIGTSATAVNDAGQVVGSGLAAGNVYHAFSWTEAGGMVDLGALSGDSQSYAVAVNDAGLVVVNVQGRDERGFAWTKAGGMVDLGTLGGTRTEVAGVNDAGVVVGFSADAAGQSHAFRWTQAGGMVDLGTPGGRASWARAINDAGQVAGDGITAGGEYHAFSWTPSGGMVDLGALAGKQSEGAALSGTGLVAGRSDPASGQSHAVLWRLAGDEAPPVLTLPEPPIVDATSPSGATVAFSVSATDAVDPSPVLGCSPSPGSLFPVGETSVTCTATDASGNAATGSFTVHVRGAAEQIHSLRATVAGAGLQRALAGELQSRLNRAARNLDAPPVACKQLEKLTEAVFGELGTAHTSLGADTADRLLGAMTVEQALGCLPADSVFPQAAHDTVAFVSAVDHLGASGPWVRDLRTTASEVGQDLARGDRAAAAQLLGGIDGAVRTDAARGKLTAVEAEQLHALVAQIGRDLEL